jgi:ABC-type nickel/cobalt efflux system permease component RcnA
MLGGIIALVGLQFQDAIETQQGHIVGAVLVITGVIFLIWGLIGHGPHDHSHGEGHHHHHHDHSHGDDDHDHDNDHGHSHEDHHAHDEHHHHNRKMEKDQSLVRRLAAITIPFGVAASPDLTILPVAFAASAVGKVTVGGVLGIFALFTIGTFIILTVIATLAGYQIKGEWLEKNANTITSLVLIAIGAIAYFGF